jgi:hypothetical protein
MTIALAMISLTGNVEAQTKFIWLRLSNDQVMINVRYERLQGDTLVVLRGIKSVPVPLSTVTQIRVFGESSIIEDAILGTGIGLVGGALLGSILPASSSEGWSPLRTSLVFGVVGGIVGGVYGSLQNSEDIVDFRNRSTEEKIAILKKLLSDGLDKKDF